MWVCVVAYEVGSKDLPGTRRVLDHGTRQCFIQSPWTFTSLVTRSSGDPLLTRTGDQRRKQRGCDASPRIFSLPTFLIQQPSWRLMPHVGFTCLLAKRSSAFNVVP